MGLRPPKIHVMPAQAGIHDFLPSVITPLDPGAAKKSRMPAFAGMTVDGDRNPFIRDFNRME